MGGSSEASADRDGFANALDRSFAAPLTLEEQRLLRFLDPPQSLSFSGLGTSVWTFFLEARLVGPETAI